MIDDDDKDELELDLDLDLEGALDAWESEFEDKAKAESSPMPQTAPPPGTPRRPLYRPDPELERRAAAQRQSRPTPVASPVASKLTPEELRQKFPSFDEDDDDSSSTRVASVPQELMAALAKLEESEGKPTAPPPSSGGVDLDLDDLLGEMEADTSLRDIEPPPAAQRPSRPESEAEAAAAAAIDALAQEEILDPFGDDEGAEAAIDALLFSDGSDAQQNTGEPSDERSSEAEREQEKLGAADAGPEADPPPVVPPPTLLSAPPVPAPAALETKPPSAFKPKPPSAYKPKPPSGFPPPSAAPVGSEAASAARSEPPGDERADHDISTRADEPELEVADEPELEVADEPELEVADEPELEVADEPELEVADEPELEVADEPELEVADEPELEVADEPELEVADEPELEVADEPELEVADEPELEVADEPELEVADEPELGLPRAHGSQGPPASDDLDELAPPPAAASTTPLGDHGAETARRTVTHRRPRAETYALVGHDAETQRRRAGLLVALGERSSGSAAARSFLAAAEIFERLGRDEDARDLFQRAHQADPHELMALRSLRRDAIARAKWSRAAELLEAETGLALSPSDRAHAWLLLAEIRLHQLGDSAAAEEAARAAMDAEPSVAAGLLLVEARRAQDRSAETFVALQETATVWADPSAASALLEMAGRLAERAGKQERAREAYAQASTRESSFGALLAVARTTEGPARSDRLAAAATRLTTPALIETVRRLAAVLGPKEAALDLLDDAKRPLSLRTKANIARRTGRNELRAETVTALASVTGTTERALALVDLAEARAADGDLDAAEQALRDAALADPALDTVHVVREVLARQAGDSSRLARAVNEESDSGGALQAAAKVAGGTDLPLERQWLEQAATRGEAPIAADVLRLDAAAEAEDDEALIAALRRQADRATPEQRLGPLAELAAMRPDEQPTLWREAMVEDRSLVALRALSRTLAADEPAEAARLLLEEADVAETEGAFQALLDSGRLLARAGDLDAAREALVRACDVLPGASPASWALDELLAAAEDLEGWVASLRHVIDSAQTPLEGADAAVRASLIEFDPESAGGLLERACELLERAGVFDPILDSLLASASGIDARSRASFLEDRTRTTEGPHARQLRLRAAAAFEQAGDAAKAATLYREVLSESPDIMVEAALDRAELAAGEHARVSSRRFDAVKVASTPKAKLLALEALANLDLRERGELSSGLLTLQSILAEAPDHLPTLRALERHYLGDDRDDELIGIERALVEHLPEAKDVVAPARLATRLLLLRGETPGDAADPIVMLAADRFLRDEGPTDDHWLARRVHAAARAAGDTALSFATLRHLLAQLATAPDEQAALSVPLAELASELEGPAAAAEILAPHAAAHPNHPTVLEAQARALRDAGDSAGSGAAFEQAANASSIDGHRVELLYAAGRCWEEADAPEAALAAYEQAVDLDVTYADLFERARRLLESAGAREGVAALLQRRLAAGADQSTKVALYEEHARVAEELGDRRSARDSLRAALTIDPERPEALKHLAELSLAEGDWRVAAESLIRIARLRQDRDELRWVFFTLGDIYDEHMPDPKRAEAAFRRVLKLVPEDLEALDRLARLFEREQLYDKAIDTLQELADCEIDPDEQRRHRLRLAHAHEHRGDLRSAEHVLEATRRQEPTNLEVLRAIADLYERQGAQSALAVHLNRAVSDFRRILLEDPADPMAWPGLVEVLEWRQRRDPARAVASAAFALGMADADLTARLGANGSIPGAGASAAVEEMRDLLAPPALNTAVHEVFHLAAEAFDKALPFDPRAWRAEKASRSHPARSELLRLAQLFDVRDVQLLITKTHPRICAPVSERPVTLLVGEEILSVTDETERAFLFMRALAAANAHLSVAMRSDPADLYLLIAGLLRAYDPNHAPAGLDPHALEDMAKRVYKGIPRRVRDEVGPLAIEMGGAPGFDAAKLRAAAAELGDRVALLALGSLKGALDALVKMNAGPPPTDRISAVRGVPEAWSLLHFALSDTYFEARHRADCDRQ